MAASASASSSSVGRTAPKERPPGHPEHASARRTLQITGFDTVLRSVTSVGQALREHGDDPRSV
ncbi:hypothetical protein ACFVHB_34785 [Kitasatospora sp. NPDC127111]|uniref:hypothetical protein n=1 Tax=Kitasatospora sp. NPDC127111 TaxID=3345363 RepID=UPI0036445CB6